jgi:high affinity sulfate transporter 1
MSNAPIAQTPKAGSTWLPALSWLKTYQPAWVRADLIAAITLAAYMLPAGIGDASLANLPPQVGLYACLFGGLVFWLFCSSRHTAITVTSAISLLVGASLGPIAGGDPARFAALASLTALLVAVIALLGWLTGAGSIVNFISESVLDGWKTGVALYLGSTQLPKLFGFSGSHGDFWERSGHFFSHLHETNTAALTLGLIALAVLIAGKTFLKNKPIALFVVIGGIIAASTLGLDAQGVKLLGEVPQGLPSLSLPPISREDINALLPLAFACFMLGAVESAAIGRMFGTKHRNRFDANQELLALAGANFAASIGQGYPIAGGMSQSLVNESGGARTPLSGFFASLILLVVVLFLSALLKDLPQCVLAAIVLVAVSGLFKFAALKHLWKASRTEFIAAIAATLGVLGAGLLHGVLIGAIISLVLLLRRASIPHVALLGRVPGTATRFTDLDRHSDNEQIPGVAIFRPESSVIYFNVDHICACIRNRVNALESDVRLIVIDLSAAAHVDVQGAHNLAALAEELTAQGKMVRVVEARSSVRDRLHLEGVDGSLGGVNRFSNVADVIQEFQKNASPP